MCPAILHPDVKPYIEKLFLHHGSARTFSVTAKPEFGHNNDLVELLELHDPRHVSALSAQLRRVVDTAIWTKLGWLSRIASTSQATQKITSVTTDNTGAAIVLSTAGSGFVREAAIRSLHDINSPFCFALLLARLNDWVKEVRSSAREKLELFIEADPALYSELALSCMDIIMDQSRFQRADELEAQTLERLLAIPMVTDGLRAVIMQGTGDRSPRLLHLALGRDRFDPWLPMIGANATHTRCRALATDALLKGSVEIVGPCGKYTRKIHLPVDRTAMAIAGLTDTSIDVRKSALDYVIDKQLSWPGDETALLNLIKDPALTVAERAWFILRSRDIDFLEFLKQGARAEPPDVFSVRALGKFGPKDCQNQTYDAAQRCCSRHQIVCLHAAAALGHPAAIPELKSIASTSASLPEARKASKSLRRLGDQLSFAEVSNLISDGVDVKERGMLPLMGSLSAIKMARVAALMKIDASDCSYEPYWRRMALKRNQGAFQPSAEDLRHLSDESQSMPALSKRIENVLGIRLSSSSSDS